MRARQRRAMAEGGLSVNTSASSSSLAHPRFSEPCGSSGQARARASLFSWLPASHNWAFRLQPCGPRNRLRLESSPDKTQRKACGRVSQIGQK